MSWLLGSWTLLKNAITSAVKIGPFTGFLFKYIVKVEQT